MSLVSGCVLIYDGDLRLRGMMTHGLASRMAFDSCGVEYEGRRLGIEPCNSNTSTSHSFTFNEPTTIAVASFPTCSFNAT